MMRIHQISHTKQNIVGNFRKRNHLCHQLTHNFNCILTLNNVIDIVWVMWFPKFNITETIRSETHSDFFLFWNQWLGCSFVNWNLRKSIETPINKFKMKYVLLSRQRDRDHPRCDKYFL